VGYTVPVLLCLLYKNVKIHWIYTCKISVPISVEMIRSKLFTLFTLYGRTKRLSFKKWKSRGNTGKLVPVLTLRLNFLNCLIQNTERYKEMLFYGRHTNPIYTGCPRRNGQNFGRVFLMLNYTDITQNTYIQRW